MAASKAPQLTRSGWLALAQSADVRDRIQEGDGLADVQAIPRVLARCQSLDWDAAVAAVHMVYGWMPTMLRTIQTPVSERDHLLAALAAVRRGELLDDAQLGLVECFANRSIVGASKLLYALNPVTYAIWDSRVANAFLWFDVSRETYATRARYVEYLATLHQWVKEDEIIRQCRELRALHPALVDASDLRMVELVLFLSKEPADGAGKART